MATIDTPWQESLALKQKLNRAVNNKSKQSITSMVAQVRNIVSDSDGNRQRCLDGIPNTYIQEYQMNQKLKDIRKCAAYMAAHQKALRQFHHPKFGKVIVILSDADIRVVDAEAKRGRLSRSNVLFGPAKEST